MSHKKTVLAWLIGCVIALTQPVLTATATVSYTPNVNDLLQTAIDNTTYSNLYTYDVTEKSYYEGSTEFVESSYKVYQKGQLFIKQYSLSTAVLNLEESTVYFSEGEQSELTHDGYAYEPLASFLKRKLEDGTFSLQVAHISPSSLITLTGSAEGTDLKATIDNDTRIATYFEASVAGTLHNKSEESYVLLQDKWFKDYEKITERRDMFDGDIKTHITERTFSNYDFTSNSLSFSLSALESTNIFSVDYVTSELLTDNYIGTASLSSYSEPVIKIASDTTSPNISNLELDGQTIEQGDFVSDTPDITADISDDESSIVSWNVAILSSSDQVVYDQSGTTGSSLTAQPTTPLESGTYTIEISVENSDGLVGTLTSPEIEVEAELRITGALNGPNPFNPNQESTQIQYQLSKEADVSIYMYSISGESIWNTMLSAGSDGGKIGFNSVEWDGTNLNGEIMANGVYIAYVTASSDGDKQMSKIKIMVLK